jgi:hypothetical protein
MRSLGAWLVGAAFGAGFALCANAGTLDQVKARGQLTCGANPGLAGLNALWNKGGLQYAPPIR